MKTAGWILAAVALAPTEARADPLGDARALLDRLGKLGDHNLGGAQQGIRDARALAEGLWPGMDPVFRLRWTEAQSALAEARRLWSLPRPASARPSLARPPDWSQLEGQLAAYGRTIDGMVAARGAYLAAANARSQGSLDFVMGDLRQRVALAVGALRALLPGPVGTRPATRPGKCGAPGTGLQVDCQVPNGPPSDDEVRAAIAAGNGALADIGRASAIARNDFERRLQAEFDAQLQRFGALVGALTQATVAVHQAQLGAIQELKG